MIAELIIAATVLYFSYVLSATHTAYGYITSFILAMLGGQIIKRAIFPKKKRKKQYSRRSRR